MEPLLLDLEPKLLDFNILNLGFSDPQNGPYSDGLSVVTGQVQETVDVFMAIILVMIVIFLAVHLFIRFHYKAKTEYALNELREKFDKNPNGSSAFALPKDPKKAGDSAPKPVEILMEPEQLAPMVHYIAMAPPGKAEQPNKNVFYNANP
ncbi:uncharacterized protein CELE_Y38F1A.7 [Caenorhabditis elegans]|uniref:Uncharacterized protein n=1 Tax=Caenorhabditis elegans TaxID=6239 RepID=Q9XWM3_CAEEL|nr:Uncharacterized protein CELE_Y38F1A.7 [Caenorhabditis elegans]CAA21632.1 Uncharacterized protein CELE_Y38F1A.7 [Caenorhabditis elegans]|eukprot:NP_496765.1 Uncharacterized protein CELE_Y38F1A.7 [Caenorhabditis elegans]